MAKWGLANEANSESAAFERWSARSGRRIGALANGVYCLGHFYFSHRARRQRSPRCPVNFKEQSRELEDIAKQLANLGLPILGAAVAGPAGAIAGKGLAAALGLGAQRHRGADGRSARNVSGEQIVALKALDAQMAKDQLEAGTAQVEAVNKTLQTEAMGGSWLQRTPTRSSRWLRGAGLGCVLHPAARQDPRPGDSETAWLTLGAIWE